MAIFGYNTIGTGTGGVNALTGDTIVGSKFTASQSGTITKIWAYLFLNASGTAPVQVAVYSDASGTMDVPLATSGGTSNLSSTTGAWVGVDIIFNITAGVTYWLVAWCDTSGLSTTYGINFDAIGTLTIGITWANSYPTWPNPVSANEAYDNATASIYADFTPTNPAYGQIPSITGLFSVTGLQSITFFKKVIKKYFNKIWEQKMELIPQ